MNSGTDIRPLSGTHSDVFSFAPECMPDKIAGQAQFSGRIENQIFICKIAGVAQW